MPTKTSGWLAKDGIVYPDLAKAQQVDLATIFDTGDKNEVVWCEGTIAAQILKNADVILSILTTGPTSRPGARKKAGTTAPRRAAKRATQAQVVAGISAMRQAASEGGTNSTHDADVPAEAPAVN